MKLHAVAPGGPPEGHCKKKRNIACTTTFDDPFRTRDTGENEFDVHFSALGSDIGKCVEHVSESSCGKLKRMVIAAVDCLGREESESQSQGSIFFIGFLVAEEEGQNTQLTKYATFRYPEICWAILCGCAGLV